MKTIDSNKIFGTPMLTDSGLETTLLFSEKIDLPHFAAFPLLNKPQYHNIFTNYYVQHLELAKKHKTGFVLESATWRANTDWGYKLGYSKNDLVKLNTLAIKQLRKIKQEYSEDVNPILISGCIGPRTDGYRVINAMTTEESRKYHQLQISTFKKAGVDFTSAFTMNYVEEALGIVLSAKDHDLPVVISFTVETDGKLPSGEALNEAIEKIDKHTASYPLYYMVNCAHPSHFISQLDTDKSWINRIKGIRANASCKSHAELDNSTEIDSGDTLELANWYKELRVNLPNLTVYGGCCGTDVSHIEQICEHIRA